MIWDSRPWKQELFDSVERLTALHEQADWEKEEVDFQAERDVMVGAYAVRKLLDAKKLTRSIDDRPVNVTCFTRTGRVPDLMNWHRFDEFYDLDSGTSCQQGVRTFCNQMIHSFVWVPEPRDDESTGLEALFFSSEFRRERELLRVEIGEVIRLFTDVASDDVMGSIRHRDDKGQWLVKNYGPEDQAELDFLAGRFGIDDEGP